MSAATGKAVLAEEEQFDAWKVEGLDFPSFRIMLLAKAMDRLTIRQLSAASQMPVAEWRVLSRLALLCEGEGLTVRQIAEKAWVDRAEVSRAARALEAKGLVARRNNPLDGRAPILSVTEKGIEFFRPIMKMRTEFHARVMRGFTPEERQTLDAMLEKMALNLPAMMEGESRRRRVGSE